MMYKASGLGAACAICEEGKQRKETVYWLVRLLALHEAEYVGNLEEKLNVGV